jgi:hypothetical protein
MVKMTAMRRPAWITAGVAVAALVVFWLGAPQAFSADELRADASVDRNVVGVGERLVLTINIYGGGQLIEPDLGNVEGFTVVNTSRSQTLSIVNFDAVRSLTLQYVLAAVSEGEYVLGPFKVQSGKETYETDPIKVTVVKGQAPAQTSPQQAGGESDAVLVRATVDKRRAFVGQQITYNLQFAYRATPRDIEYTPPEHTGFWTEEIGETEPSIETIDGRKYYVVNKRSAFFPISSGNFTIGQASVRYRVSELRPFSFDPFDMGGGREGRAVTEPVDIIVRPLPSEGRPAGFSGAVGSFDLDVSASSHKVKTGESLTLSVRISGRGNIKSIGDIQMPEPDGFRVFTPKAKESVDVKGSQVGGEKVFELVLVPERPGEQVIDGLEFSYFDPEREEYVTRRSAPITISVLPGDDHLAAGRSGGSPEAMVTRRDIRHIKRAAIARDGLAISERGVSGVVFTYLPVLMAVAGLIVSVQRRHAAVSGKGALSRAYKTALTEIKQAGDAAGRGMGTADAAGRAARAVRSYLAVRAGTTEALIDRDAILSMTAIAEDLRSDVSDLLGSLDRIRFAPVAVEGAEVMELIARARSLLATVSARWGR